MGQIEDLRLYIDIVDQGSISKASAKLNIAKSAVSRRLALLEERYQTRLIDRVPGQWEITETGQELYRRAMGLIIDVGELEGDFTKNPQGLSGPLSISVPRDFGLSFLHDALVKFQCGYPEIRLSIDFEDRIIDLDRENYDFAIRITGAPINDLLVYKIGTATHALYANKAYIEQHGQPNTIGELRNHRLLNYGSVRRASWEFMDKKNRPVNLEFRPFLSSNSGQFLLKAAGDGLGIARLPNFLIGNPIDQAALIQVLPDSVIADWNIYLVFSEKRRLNRRMKLFLDQMQKACLTTMQRV